MRGGLKGDLKRQYRRQRLCVSRIKILRPHHFAETAAKHLLSSQRRNALMDLRNFLKKCKKVKRGGWMTSALV